MKSALIISGSLVQDHEFIYPYYRLLEANSKLDVCLIGGKPVQGILGTQLPPNKDHPVKDIDQIKVVDYDLLVLPGGVKAMEKIRQDKQTVKKITVFIRTSPFQKNKSYYANIFSFSLLKFFIWNTFKCPRYRSSKKIIESSI